MKLYTETDITRSNTSVLQAITVEKLVAQIKSDEIKVTIESLRKVKNLSTESYNFIKRKLPYFIGAKFKENIRNSKNFEEINYFIIDIDKYGDSNKVEQLKKAVSQDSRLVLAFVSPGGDGLKLMYLLDKPIYSLKKFSDFYKAFSLKLATQYHLENTLDFSTSDATRICFISYDQNCYYNKNAEAVITDLYIPEFDLLQHPDHISEKANKDKQESKQKNNINNQQYKDILSKLNPRTPKSQKKYIVPEVLTKVSNKLKEEFNKYNLIVENISDINYGKKITIKDGLAFARFNIFYGKNGFSVVKTPVRNSNEELLEVCVSITENFLYSNLIATNAILYRDEEKNKELSQTSNRCDEEDKTGRVIQLQTAR